LNRDIRCAGDPAGCVWPRLVLLDGIIERTAPPFTFSKVDGDAVFAFARDDQDVPRGAALLECLSACYVAFRGRLGGAMEIWTCRCNACSPIAARVYSLG